MPSTCSLASVLWYRHTKLMITGHYKNLWAKLRKKIVEIIEILTKSFSRINWALGVVKIASLYHMIHTWEEIGGIPVISGLISFSQISVQVRQF